MENLQIKSEYLTLEEQLRVLEKVRASSRRALCFAIDDAMVEEIPMYYSYPSMSSCIPLFTRENAIKYANAKVESAFWWKTSPFDFKSRLKFLDWMIEKIREEMNKNIK